MVLVNSLSKISVAKITSQEILEDLTTLQKLYPDFYNYNALHNQLCNSIGITIFYGSKRVGFLYYKDNILNHLYVNNNYDFCNIALVTCLPDKDMWIYPIKDNYIQYRSMLDVTSLRRYIRGQDTKIKLRNPKSKLDYLIDHVTKKLLGK